MRAIDTGNHRATRKVLKEDTPAIVNISRNPWAAAK
jgi:hypothetical protein